MNGSKGIENSISVEEVKKIRGRLKNWKIVLVTLRVA